MSGYSINSAGMPVADDNDWEQKCWVCGEYPGCDGLCTKCTGFVLYGGAAEEDILGLWDAEASKRGLPAIDRETWHKFYQTGKAKGGE